MNEMKTFNGTPTEKEFFSDKENGKKYKALKKEYKKIRFLENNSEEIRLTDAEKSIIANRKTEIESIVSNWPTDIKVRFQKDTIPTTLWKSLPGSFRYDEIKLPTFDRKEPKLHTWEDEIRDWNFFPLAYYAQRDKINDAKKMASQHNSRVQSIYDNERKAYEKKIQSLKPRYDDRKTNYKSFMNYSIKEKMSYDMPDCYMKEVLQYLSKLIKCKETGKNIERNQFPYRVSNQTTTNKTRQEMIKKFVDKLCEINRIYSHRGLICKYYVELLCQMCEAKGICDISDVNLIVDWMKNFFQEETVDIEQLEKGLFNSEDLSDIQITKMNQAADRIIGFLNIHNSFENGNLDNNTNIYISQASGEPIR